MTFKWSKKWNKNLCYNEAIKYKSRSEFNKKSLGAYLAAYRKGWLDDICKHM